MGWEEAKAKGNAAYADKKLLEAIEYFSQVRTNTTLTRAVDPLERGHESIEFQTAAPGGGLP